MPPTFTKDKVLIFPGVSAKLKPPSILNETPPSLSNQTVPEVDE